LCLLIFRNRKSTARRSLSRPGGLFAVCLLWSHSPASSFMRSWKGKEIWRCACSVCRLSRLMTLSWRSCYRFSSIALFPRLPLLFLCPLPTADLRSVFQHVLVKPDRCLGNMVMLIPRQTPDSKIETRSPLSALPPSQSSRARSRSSISSLYDKIPKHLDTPKKVRILGAKWFLEYVLTDEAPLGTWHRIY
jgi:hypothetical protein